MSKIFFIPHKGNNYQPHLLHPKRAWFYGSFLVLVKCVVTVAILFLPATAFLSEDISAQKEKELVELTNYLRLERQAKVAKEHQSLHESAKARSEDMRAKQYFSHIGPNGENLKSFLEKADYNYASAGENLAIAGYDMSTVMNFWVASESHFANLIDPRFDDIGISVVPGEYQGRLVTFVTQHLGTEQKKGNSVVKAPYLDFENSTVTWKELAGQTVVSAKVQTLKQVDDVVIQVFGETIEMERTDQQNSYQGEINIEKSPEELFKVVVAPVVKMQINGKQVEASSVAWTNNLLPKQSFWSKYSIRKNLLPNHGSVYSFGRNLFLIFLGIFGLTFFVYLAVTGKKRHHHIVKHNLWFLALLVVLILL